MGALRALGLGAAAALVVSGLGVVGAPAARAADPALPGPSSDLWSPVLKTVDGTTGPMTDAAGDFATAHLDLTPVDATTDPSTVFMSADLDYIYVRFHVAALPPNTGAYVLQIDTDANPAGWERAVRYDDATDTISYLDGGANAGAKTAGTQLSSVPATALNSASYAGTTGAYVAFALARTDLTAAGVPLAGPVTMVIGTTSVAGANLDAGGLLSAAKADVLGAGKFSGLSAPAWSTLTTDAIDLRANDRDGDGVIDGIDNCPDAANPSQADDDAALDNNYPYGTPGTPDGTEGKGNACDSTPRGLDPDQDKSGWLDDQCPEQYGLLSNGCPAQSTTTATLRYVAKRKRFTGVVRADFDQCVPRRAVTVFRQVKGPDRQVGSDRTSDGGRYAVGVSKRPKNGKYYARVDPKWTLGARCFFVKSPRIKIG